MLIFSNENHAHTFFHDLEETMGLLNTIEMTFTSDSAMLMVGMGRIVFVLVNKS
jgi:hypothetical protein